jgi:hypothetical protein
MIEVKTRGVTIGLKPEAIILVGPAMNKDVPILGKCLASVMGVGDIGIDESVGVVIERINTALEERKLIT